MPMYPAELVSLNSDGRSLKVSKAIVPYVNAGYVGTRMFPMAASSSSTAFATNTTYHYCLELPHHIDGIQLMVGCKNYNVDSPTPIMDFTATVATGVNIADVNANSVVMSSRLTWPYFGANNTVGRIDATTMLSGAGTQEAKAAAYQLSNPIDVASKVRTDGRPWGLVYVRVVVQNTSTANIKAVAGQGSWATAGAWNALEGGQRMFVRSQAGNFDNAGALGSGFTSSTEVVAHPLIGIVYQSRGKVVNVAHFGASTGAGGASTNSGRSYSLDPLIARNVAAQASGNPVMYERAHVCFGEMNVGVQRGMYKMLAPTLKPDIVLWDIGDLSSIFGQTTLAGAEAWMSAYGVRPTLANISNYLKAPRPIIIPATWAPCGTGFDQSGSDIVRQGINTAFRQSWDGPYVDVDALVADPASVGSGRVTLLSQYENANHFHMSLAAYNDIAPLFEAALATIQVG